MQVLARIMQRFTAVQAGQLLRDVYPAHWRMDVQEAIAALARGEHIETGEGIAKRSLASSVILRADRQTGGRGVAAAMLPLQPYVASDATTPKIGLTIGTFGANAEATTGTSVPLIGSTRIDYSTAPALTVAVGNRLLYLKITVNSDGLITEVKAQATSDVDPPANTPYTIFYVRLCTMVVTAPSSVTLGTFELAGSQTWELCGGTTPLWRLS